MQAYSGAQGLGAGLDSIRTAMGNTANAIGSVPYASAGTLQRAQLGGPAMAFAPTYNGATLGGPSRVDLSGLGTIQAQQAAAVDPAGGGSATAGFAKDYIADYKPFADRALVQNTMDSFADGAGRQTAAYAAQAAGRGAFGGSRQAIGEAQLRSDLAREGGLLRAQMEDQAYTRALQAAQGDANNVTGANVANAANATQASIANNRTASDMAMFNAGQQNQFGLRLMDLLGEASLANAGYDNQFKLVQFGADSDAARLQYQTLADLYGDNADRLNQFGLAQFGADNASNALQYSTGADMSRFNAGLQSDYYNQRLAQAQQLGSLGGLLNSAQNQNIATQADIGSMIQQIQQRQDLAPYAKQQMIADLLGGGGLLSLATGQTVEGSGTKTTKESGGLLGQILGSAAQLGSAAIMASDIRVKRDVEKLAEEPDGLGVYRFNYVWDDENDAPRFGVMAQEVAILRPWALGPEVDGVMTVNYGAL